MNINYKGSLLEYCQARQLPSPQFKLIDESGPPHSRRFQAEVRVDGYSFVGDNMCLTKKKAEQSAARVACHALTPTNQRSIFTQSNAQQQQQQQPRAQSSRFLSLPPPPPTPPPSYSSLSMHRSMKHMPPQYANIERFIIDIISPEGGRIRKIWDSDNEGKYQLEITGTYRYCENVHRQHRKNHVYFIVDPVRKTFCQKCHDPECLNYQSPIKSISIDEHPVVVRRRPIFSINDSTSPKHFRYGIE